ncbi:hypothetical protein BCR44DRAFT_1426158 [Catenaria anguillulae PL171]|uniref:Uncharacterized protein n=1 Tax=Catenaria anguillulae PL171 TaxID=765915 RepID=A0A1Y2HZM3_9FUNG|nr:hypothetical protein BCR44DRAFT_1426158 [Catenaria anguillulae PL171]
MRALGIPNGRRGGLSLIMSMGCCMCTRTRTHLFPPTRFKSHPPTPPFNTPLTATRDSKCSRCTTSARATASAQTQTSCTHGTTRSQTWPHGQAFRPATSAFYCKPFNAVQPHLTAHPFGSPPRPTPARLLWGTNRCRAACHRRMQPRPFRRMTRTCRQENRSCLTSHQ